LGWIGLWMKIIACCPVCGKSWLFGADVADKRVLCQGCGRLFRVPRLEDVPKAVKVIEAVRGRIYVDEEGRTYG